MSSPAPSRSPQNPRLVFIANTMYSTIVSGGEVHTEKLTQSALRAGYQVHFFTGHALKGELEQHKFPVSVTLTDKRFLKPRNFDTLAGQLRLFADYAVKVRGSLRRLSEIQPEDIVYCATDLWWDVIPTLRCRARRKIMYLGMDAPTFREIVLQSRPDVKTIRLPSIHYSLSQNCALRRFRHCPNKKLIYAHPNQKPRLLRLGYHEEDLVGVYNGVDLEKPAAVPEQPRIYDVAWVGRMHKQKGVEDLVDTLEFLSRQLKDFRAIMVGNLKASLGEVVRARGLSHCIDFAGYVPEEEKFRLLKSSRVFLMPSRYESWGIVIGEALAAGLPVVAYKLEAYPDVFGDLLHYVRPFDLGAFKEAALEEVRRTRAGERRIDRAKLERFIRENSWEAVGERFLGAVRSLGG